VTTAEPHEHAVLNAIHELGLEWHVGFNKGALMALPADVTRATGLAPAFQELGIAPEQTVGVGHAENDQSLLCLCGVAAAVANALPAVQTAADLVTSAPQGAVLSS
jgi:hydroxymethylpyrimidine pyrophosphatase-like HAD family hydrolase